jgi:hypothetical protein
MKCTGQAENWGKPLGGTDYLLARTGGGFKRANQLGRVAGRKV